MAEKIINSRIQLKTDTSINWGKATTFVPKKGEFIFYSDIKRFKIGDGITKVSALDFANEEAKMVTKVQFDEVWKYQDESWEIVHNGTLTSTQAYHYTEYVCISIDLYGPADAVEASNRYIYLFLQSNYYEDNDVTDYWRWVGYDRSNIKYTLDIVHNFDSDTWTWTLTTGSSSGSGSGSGGSSDGKVYDYNWENYDGNLYLDPTKSYYVHAQTDNGEDYGSCYVINGQIKGSNLKNDPDFFELVANATPGSFSVSLGDSAFIYLSVTPLQYVDTCLIEGTSILVRGSSGELTSKKVEEIAVGDELAYWSPINGQLVYNKVLAPASVGECYNYKRVYFSDGSNVDVFGNHMFWDIDQDMMINYKKMTSETRVCKYDGAIINFDHIESLHSNVPLKHYMIMTERGRYLANGVQTGDKVELFYARLMTPENQPYWNALSPKQQEFYKQKQADGLERRNWKYSELCVSTLRPYRKELANTQKKLKEKQSYLDSTDYQVIKKMEGLLTDEEFAPTQAARQEARDAINVARARIAELEATIKEKEAEVKATIYGKRKYTYHNAFEGKTRAVLDYEEPSAD